MRPSSCRFELVSVLSDAMTTPEQIARTFYFKGRAAGYFENDELPAKPGQYRYMPVRSAAHFALMAALRTGESQQCHYVVAGAKRYFLILRWVEYGALELGKVEESSAGEA